VIRNRSGLVGYLFSITPGFRPRHAVLALAVTLYAGPGRLLSQTVRK